MRVLALDYGSARCGCAVSDPTGIVARPLDPVLRPGARHGMRQIVELAHELGVERVVVGLPLSLNGEDSAQTREARTFARGLGKWLKEIPIELYDERFTTRLAQRDPQSHSSEDSRAAAHLLSSWLDAHNAWSARG